MGVSVLTALTAALLLADPTAPVPTAQPMAPQPTAGQPAAPTAGQPAAPAAGQPAAPAGQPAAPAEAPVTLSAEATPETVTLGATLTLKVTARHGTDVKVYFPAEPDIKPFRVISTTGPERVMEGETVVQTWHLTVQTLRLGKRRIAPFGVSYEAEGGQVGTVMTPPVRVAVDGTLDPSASEHPVASNAPPFQVFDKNWALIIGLIALAVITVTAGITLVAARYVARLSRRGPPPPLPRPAHELAGERIAALRAEQLLPKGLLKEFVFRTSEILREYLGKRYGIDALERTSSELLNDMKRLSPKGLSLYELESFLEGTDIFKFANIPPTHGEADRTLETIEKLIAATRQSDSEVAEGRAKEELRRRLEKPAHPFKRLFAVGVDVLALAALSTGLLYAAHKLGWSWLPWVDLALVTTLFLLRDVAGEGSPGKVLSGLGVAPLDDTRSAALDLGPRVLRNLTLLLPIAGHTMELVIMVYAADGRRVGDRWARTRVLDRRPDASEYSFLVLAIFAFAAAAAVAMLPLWWWKFGGAA